MPTPSHRRARIAAEILFGFAILFKVADALIPRAHTDVLYYTLYAPKLFHFYGWDTLIHDLVPYLMTGIMEMTTLLFFRFTENLGWIHVLAQLTTLASSLLLGAILVRRWVADPFVAALGGFSILTFSRSSATFIFAKGDGPLGIFAMIAGYAILRDWSPWAVGILLGLLPSFKLSGIYPAAALAAVFLWKNRRRPRVAFIAGTTALAVFAPTLLRNYWVIGNPVYPALLERFPGRASPAILEFGARYFKASPNREFVRRAVEDLVRGKLFFGLWIYFFFARLRSDDRSTLLLPIAAIGAFIGYVATNGVYQDARFFFATFFLLALFVFLELDRIFRSDRPHFLKSSVGMIFLLALALIDSRLESAPAIIVGNLRELATSPMDEIVARAAAREKPIRDVFPAHPVKRRRILSEVTAEGYYLDPSYRLEHISYSRSAGFLTTCEEADLPRLDAYDYFIISPTGTTPCHAKIRGTGRFLGKFSEPGPTEIYAIER